MNKILIALALLVIGFIGFRRYQKDHDLPAQLFFEGVNYSEMLRQSKGGLLGTRVQYIPKNQSKALWTDALVIVQFKEESADIAKHLHGINQIFKLSGASILDMPDEAQCVVYPFSADAIQVDYAVVLAGPRKSYRVSKIQRFLGEEAKKAPNLLCQSMSAAAQSLRTLKTSLPDTN